MNTRNSIPPWLPFLFFFYSSFFQFVTAQEDHVIITGQIVDPENNPLVGVNIIIKGTTRGGISDSEGKYAIRAAPDDLLVFSYVGFATFEQRARGQNTLNITLIPDIEEFEQIIVVGYGRQKKKWVTGATGSLAEEEFNNGIINSPEQLIQAKIAGVDLVSNSGEPGDGFSIRIRGASTIRAGNEPLFVVDGYPLDITTTTPGNTANIIGQGAPQKNPLSFLNPEDIASIYVLKDASAGAIYGARAANGVVLIETKSGRSGKTQLQYSTYASVAHLRKKLDVLSPGEWRAAQAANGFGGNDFGANTDWQEETFRTTFAHNHDLVIQGGNDKTTYRTAFQFLDQEGILKGNDWARLSGRVKIQHRALRDRLTLLGNLSLSRIHDKPSNAAGIIIRPSLDGADTNPTYPVYNEDGSLFRPSPLQVTPVGHQQLSSDLITTNRLLANLTAAYSFFDGLEYKIHFGGDNAVATRRSNESIDLAVQTNGKATLSEREAGSILIEHYFTYNGHWANHSLTTLVGYSFQEFITKDFILSRSGFSSDEILNVNNIASGTELIINESGVEKSALQSYFARLNYQYQERYLLTFNFRADGSTRFGADNRYGFFPSVAVGWRLSEESFFQGLSLIDQLKFRASWGITGNQEIPNKITQFVLGTPLFSSYVLDGSNATAGYTFVRTPNDQLQWEETSQINAGLDFSLWSGRLHGSVDYFDKRTSNLLAQIFAASAPTTMAWTNLDAEVLNRGLEFSLSGVIWHKNRFKWESSLTFTVIENEVQGLPTDLFTGDQIITNGEPLGTFWGRKWLGFDVQGMDSLLKNPDGTDAFVVIGHALPDFTWGWAHQFRLGNFDLSFLLQGIQSNVINGGTILSKVGFPQGGNVTKEVLETPESFGNVVRFSSRFLQDGSFVRLNYLTVGYQFPVDAIDWLGNLRIYLTGTNLLLWTDYSGYDPEVNIATTRADRFGRSSGIPTIGNGGGYPRARTFQLGLRVTFL